MDGRKIIMIVALLVVIVAGALLYYGHDDSGGVGTSCTSEQRGAEICISLYSPVCGHFNSSIQCVKYPCAETFSNSCFACSNPSVEYWTEGEC